MFVNKLIITQQMAMEMVNNFVSVTVKLFETTVIHVKNVFLKAPYWILKELAPTRNIDESFFLFWNLLWISSVVIFVIIFLYSRFFKIEEAGESLKKYSCKVHHVAGNLRPSTKSIKTCIGILNEFPIFINHPKPPYNYTPFLRACWSGNATLVRYMLLNGADIHSCTTSRESPVYLAAYRVQKSSIFSSAVLDLLYNAGSPLSVPNKNGLTALHCAANAGHVSLTRWLLMHGAHQTLPPCKKTPYDFALQYEDSNHQSVAALLHLFCPDMAEKWMKKRSIVYK